MAPATLGYVAEGVSDVGVVIGIPLVGTFLVVALLLLIWLESKVTGDEGQGSGGRGSGVGGSGWRRCYCGLPGQPCTARLWRTGLTGRWRAIRRSGEFR